MSSADNTQPSIQPTSNTASQIIEEVSGTGLVLVELNIVEL